MTNQNYRIICKNEVDNSPRVQNPQNRKSRLKRGPASRALAKNNKILQKMISFDETSKKRANSSSIDEVLPNKTKK